jgi:hypothetical protein
MTKFNIGDTIYQSKAGQHQIWITCPECCGTGRLRVILGDESEVSIACECCKRGYEGSPGKVSTYKFLAETSESVITGIESRLSNGTLYTRYAIGCYSTEEENVFATEAEAQNRAKECVREHVIEETKRLAYKEKQTQTWAWNVSYWRKQIRHGQQQIESATARLNIAPKNVKEADKP